MAAMSLHVYSAGQGEGGKEGSSDQALLAWRVWVREAIESNFVQLIIFLVVFSTLSCSVLFLLLNCEKSYCLLRNTIQIQAFLDWSPYKPWSPCYG